MNENELKAVALITRRVRNVNLITPQVDDKNAKIIVKKFSKIPLKYDYRKKVYKKKVEQRKTGKLNLIKTIVE